MTTMTAIPATTASFGFRTSAPARSVRRDAPAIRTVGPAADAERHRVAGVAVRFGLALVPFSALAGMFVWL